MGGAGGRRAGAALPGGTRHSPAPAAAAAAASPSPPGAAASWRAPPSPGASPVLPAAAARSLLAPGGPSPRRGSSAGFFGSPLPGLPCCCSRWPAQRPVPVQLCLLRSGPRRRRRRRLSSSANHWSLMCVQDRAMHAERSNYICWKKNTESGYGGSAPENHHPHTANPRDLHLPRPCPRERLSPLRRRGRPTAAAAAGRGGPEGTPTPAQRLRTQRPTKPEEVTPLRAGPILSPGGAMTTAPPAASRG